MLIGLHQAHYFQYLSPRIITKFYVYLINHNVQGFCEHAKNYKIKKYLVIWCRCWKSRTLSGLVRWERREEERAASSMFVFYSLSGEYLYLNKTYTYGSYHKGQPLWFYFPKLIISFVLVFFLLTKQRTRKILKG